MLLCIYFHLERFKKEKIVMAIHPCVDWSLLVLAKLNRKIDF